MMKKNTIKREKEMANVTVMTVFESVIKTKIEAIGTAVSNESVDIKSNVTELVQSIHFNDCDHVKKGQLLVQLNIDKKQAEKKQIEALLQEQDRELKRFQQLKEKKVIQTRDYDTQYSSWLKAKAQLEKINAELKDSSITAPFDGFLGLRQVSVGALITSGTVVTTLDDISKIKVDFIIPEKYNLLVHEHETITAKSVAGPGTKFTGEILAIVPRVSQQSRSISVRGVIDNTSLLLRPGMMLKISLKLKDRTGIKIPERAVLSAGERHFVYIVKDGKILQNYVNTGDLSNGFIEITKGLKIGDKVVTGGVSKIKNNMKINVINDETDSIKSKINKK